MRCWATLLTRTACWATSWPIGRHGWPGLPEQITLPTDRPRPAVASYRGGTVPLRIDAELHGALLALARTHGATLFMVLQAGLAVLLGRLGGGEDIAIGTPIAGRTDAALDELVGFFVNSLVLRTDLSGDPDFATVLARVREAALGAYAHQDVPFERLVEALNPARSQSHHPLFQVMLALQDDDIAALELEGTRGTAVAVGLNVAKFDLTIFLGEPPGEDARPGGLIGGIEYATDLFDASSAEQLGVRLLRVLAAIVADPSLPVGRIDILGTAERQRILVDWNGTAHAVQVATLPSLFEAQVARTPDASALLFEEQSLSYGELNAQANRIAHALIARGVGPEDVVALALPRSLDMIVALLGILKSGAAYLPLDPEYPTERLSLMIGDANPRCLIGTTACAERLPEGLACLCSTIAGVPRRTCKRRPTHNPPDSERSRAFAPGELRLYHLHFRLHRAAEGRPGGHSK